MSPKLLKEIAVEERSRIFTADKVLAIEKEMKKGSIADVHWHDYFELEIVLSGKGEHTHNNVKYKTERGSAFLLSYCDFHSFAFLTDVKLLNIRFCEDLLDKELSDFISVGFHQFSCVFEEEELQQILKCAQELFEEKEKKDAFWEINMKNLISQIVITIIRKSKTEKINTLPSMVQKAVSYLYQNYRSDISLEQLAEKLSVSPNHLGMLFKKNTGVSFNEYLNRIRLKYACNLLKTSDLSIKEIAFSSGYNSAEYFLSVFKKKLLITPNAYRTNTE